METKKSGCYLINTQTKMVGLIYRDYLDDYSFPKGHLEDNESLEECAIRETAEETKRDSVIVETIKPTIDRYVTPKGETCVCYMYVAIDMGPSANTSTDTHDLIWLPIEEVENRLSYPSLKKYWLEVKEQVLALCKGE